MDNTNNNSRPLVGGGVFVLLVVSIAFQAIGLYRSFDRAKSVDDRFSTIENALSNTVAEVIQLKKRPANYQANSPAFSVSSRKVPKIIPINDLGTWKVGPSWGCCFGGVQYKLSDHTAFGQIIAIDDSSVTCRADDGTRTILRASFERTERTEGGVSRPPRAGAEEASLF